MATKARPGRSLAFRCCLLIGTLSCIIVETTTAFSGHSIVSRGVQRSNLVQSFHPTSPRSLTSSSSSSSSFPRHRLQSSNDSENDNDKKDTGLPSPPPPPPVSQIESIVANAKSLLPNKKPLNDDDENFNKNKNDLLQATVSGLAVSLAMIPEAIAFSFVAGVSPLVGLWTTVTLGFTAAALGGRAGICSSASGACSVVVAALCAQYGPTYLSACAIMAGLFQISAGVLQWGKFIRLVPHPVMLGFVNGLAIVMTRAQLVHFQSAGGKWLSLTSPLGSSVYGITALTMALVKLFPKITKVIPPSLGAVLISSILAKILNLPCKTLSDVAGAATFTGGWSVLPKLAWPAVPFSWSTLQTVLPFAATMAAVGCIESLLTMQLLDGMADDGRRGSTRRECIGQGCGNLLSGLTGGIGGCALLGQSVINMQSGGGVSRWSGMSMALFLAAGIVGCAPLLGAVPVASLVGVMLLVCQSTFSWSSLRLWNKIPKLDTFVIALVSIITVQKDLAYAVLAGTITSALGFAWKQSTQLTTRTTTVPTTTIATDKDNTNKNDNADDNKQIIQEQEEKLYTLNGPLFFGSTSQFANLFQPKLDPTVVVLDFTNCRVWDHSALVAIQDLADQYGSLGKTIRLRHLSNDCVQLLQNLHTSSGDGGTDNGKLPPYEIIESDPNTDPVYGVADSYAQLGVVPSSP